MAYFYAFLFSGAMSRDSHALMTLLHFTKTLIRSIMKRIIAFIPEQGQCKDLLSGSCVFSCSTINPPLMYSGCVLNKAAAGRGVDGASLYSSTSNLPLSQLAAPSQLGVTLALMYGLNHSPSILMLLPSPPPRGGYHERDPSVAPLPPRCCGIESRTGC